MSPLYLQGSKGVSVTLEAPALSILMSGKTRQLFPLSRISRVVVFGFVDWSMPALFACADAGVSVIFLTNEGEVRCRWLGRSSQQHSLVEQFLPLLESAGALVAYNNWQLAMQRMVVRSCARRLKIDDWQVADACFLTDWFNQLFPAEWLLECRRLQGMLVSSVLSYLMHLGFDSNTEYIFDGQINLLDDLSELLLWDFYPSLVNWYRRDIVLPEQSSRVEFYEARASRVEHLLQGLLNRLHQCLLASV